MGSGEITYPRPLRGGPPVIQWLVKPIKSSTEIVFLTVDPPQPAMDYRFKLTFDVTVRHIPGPNGSQVSPLVVVLDAILNEVKGIITSVR